MTDRSEKGLATMGEMLGEGAAAHLRAMVEEGGFGAQLGRLAAEVAFGDVWSREGLSRDRRSLITLGVLIAQGHAQELKNHVRIALANGLSAAELEEAVIQTMPYVGFPKAAIATEAMVEVLRERGLAGNGASAEERGLR